MVAALAISGASPKTPSGDPDQAKIVTDDIVRFWQAFDQAKAGDAVKAYQDLYITPGSPGVQGFLPGRIRNAADFAKNLARMPKYYEGIREQTLRVALEEHQIRAAFYALKYLYPAAVFPNVYFVIGRLSSGGISIDNGLVIGTEFYSRTASTPVDELSDWARANAKGPEGLPHIVAHELIHFQQRPTSDKSLLASSIVEGSADFLAEMISGAHINPLAHAYGDAHEAQVWAEFQADIQKKDMSRWLYNGDESKDRPADMGYYVGYKISQAYYNKATDKRRAIREILNITDFAKFARDSGYAGNS